MGNQGRPPGMEGAALRSSESATCGAEGGVCGHSFRSGWRNVTSRITFGNS
jgi:hypothetical protein